MGDAREDKRGRETESDGESVEVCLSFFFVCIQGQVNPQQRVTENISIINSNEWTRMGFSNLTWKINSNKNSWFNLKL